MLTFALRPAPKTISSGMLLPTAFLVMCAGLVIGFEIGEMVEHIGLAIGISEVTACVLFALWWKRRNGEFTPPPVTIEGGVLSGPLMPRDRAVKSVPLSAITEVALRQQGLRRMLVVGAGEVLFVWPAVSFVEEDAPDRLHRALLEEISAQPGGTEQRAAIDAHGERAVRLFARRYPATRVILAVIAVMFVVEKLTGALESSEMMLRLGAGSPALVRDGQWWRLFSVHTLHANWLHVWMNAMAIISLGPIVEQLLGTRRFTVVALLGGLIGFVASTVAARHAMAVGASAVAFALMGSLLVIQLIHVSTLPAGIAVSRQRWATMLGLNLAISLLPGIDLIAHAGGFAGGALLTYALARGEGALEQAPSRAATILAWITGVAFVLGMGATFAHAHDASVDYTEEWVRAHFDAPRERAELANAEAWRIAIDPKSPAMHLARADAALEPVIAEMGEGEPKGMVLDTWAHLAHRLGRADLAVERQRSAATLAPRADTFTTLGRYLSEAGSRGDVDAKIEGAKVHVVAGTKRIVVYARTGSGLVRALLPAGTTEADLGMAGGELLFASASGPEPDVAAVTIATYPPDKDSLKQP